MSCVIKKNVLTMLSTCRSTSVVIMNKNVLMVEKRLYKHVTHIHT